MYIPVMIYMQPPMVVSHGRNPIYPIKIFLLQALLQTASSVQALPTQAE
jgi:hypothetical protein